MSLYKIFETDKNIEVDGVWLEYDEGVKIRVARAGGANKRYLKAMEKLFRKHRKAIQLDTLPEEKARVLMREVYVDTVILGWEGVTDKEGNPMSFNRENCLKLFSDLPDLFNDVQEQAGKIALFKADLDEIDSKN